MGMPPGLCMGWRAGPSTGALALAETRCGAPDSSQAMIPVPNTQPSLCLCSPSQLTLARRAAKPAHTCDDVKIYWPRSRDSSLTFITNDDLVGKLFLERLLLAFEKPFAWCWNFASIHCFLSLTPVKGHVSGRVVGGPHLGRRQALAR